MRKIGIAAHRRVRSAASTRMDRFSALAASLIVAIGFTAFSATQSQAQSEPAYCKKAELQKQYPDLVGKSFRISMSTDSKPYGYRDPNDLDKVIGLAADYVRMIFGCLGAKTEFAIAPFSGALPALMAGQVDMIWTPLYYTPERAKSVDMVLYQKGASGIVVPKANPSHIKGPDDLCGKTVSAVNGGTELREVQETDKSCQSAGKQKINILVSADRASALRELQNGRVDAFVGIGGSALSYDDKVFAIPYVYETDIRLGAGFRKGDTELENAVRDTIAQIQASGEEAKLYATYGFDKKLSFPPVVATK